ncbi:Lrp/AsnC family transcriptional regulator [Candidatus Woesearchaeota archaeon]|jgi:Lrp/AsnC family transcriptional regulator, leucine-responsive regulatory protein|nr:Lrp/AsnC family transcriptional regulator [Candidatus Woesearchaeota archaeon]
MVYNLDEKDLKILDILKQDSSLSTRDIARKTLLPPTTIHNRIKTLKKEGVIKKFTVELDYDLLDKSLVVYVLISVDVSLLKSKSKTQYDIVDEMKKFEFVRRVDIVSGGVDLIAMLRLKDIKELDLLLLDKVQSIGGINHTKTLVVIREGK